jgi:serine-type D-Ala-D-Ala carboxypeptidase (penicillin-binding protein 5/6)
LKGLKFLLVLIAFVMLLNYPQIKQTLHSLFKKDEITQINKGIDSDLSLTGEAAVLLDSESGKMLFSKNAEEVLYPASTTKILTALIAIQNGNLDEEIRVGQEAFMKTPGESSAGLREGQVLTLQQLLKGLMLPSGNDAARTIAIYIAKKVSGDQYLGEQEAINYFAEIMNRKAKKLGATHSHFVNPNGLHDLDHFSTANDLALIAREAMKNSTFKKTVSSHIYSDQTVAYNNRNKLLDTNSPYYYEGANGIKTGFTDEAGYCLVSSASRNGNELIVVVLKSSEENVWNDSISLLDQGFSSAVANI